MFPVLHLGPAAQPCPDQEVVVFGRAIWYLMGR